MVASVAISRFNKENVGTYQHMAFIYVIRYFASVIHQVLLMVCQGQNFTPAKKLTINTS